MNGFHVLVFAATILGSCVKIPRAMRHDRVLAELEAIDYDALADDANTRYEDDADAWRKGES